MSRTQPIEVHPLTGAIGARVTGVDLSQDLDSETFSAIVDALNEYLVLTFPGQDLTPAAQSTFSQRFGPVEGHPYGARQGVDNQNPEVIVLETKPGRRGARRTQCGARRNGRGGRNAKPRDARPRRPPTLHCKKEKGRTARKSFNIKIWGMGAW